MGTFLSGSRSSLKIDSALVSKEVQDALKQPPEAEKPNVSLHTKKRLVEKNL